jgi:hypothetical protein
MAVSRAIEEEIGADRRAVARLKREIFGVDKTHRSRYIREFNAEFREFRSIASAGEVLEEASRRDIVYFGDYHPLDASQDFVLRLMRELSARGRKVVLALEMLYVHQQDSLDRWMKGDIGEDEFLDRIDYRTEWGFDWRSYRRFFELAKDPFIPVFGIDSERRDHLRYIRRRDRLAARRIGTIRKFFPEHVILVVVGESHLASNHLPARVRAELGGSARDIVIVQNIDEIYWRLLRRGSERPEAVKIDDDRYCVLTAPPMLKYQAYRRIIDVWTEGEEADTVTPPFHETIEEIYSFLTRKRRKSPIALANGRRETLETLLPEVLRRTTYHVFSAYLRSRGIGAREITAILECLKFAGMRYVPAINALLVARYRPERMIREAARFALHLRRGEIMERRGKRLAPEDERFAAAVDEALVCFAAKIVDPMLDCFGEDCMSAGRRIEAEDAGVPPLRSKRRLIDAIGRGSGVGEALHSEYRAGRVKRETVKDLFAARLDEPGASLKMYSRLAAMALGRRAPRRPRSGR